MSFASRQLVQAPLGLQSHDCILGDFHGAFGFMLAAQ